MVDRKHEQLSIRQQCMLLGIHRSNVYYQHMDESEETILANEIHEVWLEQTYYGYRKITYALRALGYNINHKKVLRLMREMGLRAIYPEPKTTLRNPEHKIYPYLLRDLPIVAPNQVWATDITYIKIMGSFMYLVAIIDIYSRFVLSWRLSNTLDTQFCLDMLSHALTNRKPQIINTDQGCQFTSSAWISLVEKNGIRVSMDGRGRWVDNIYIERFWRTLKHEYLLVRSFESVEELKIALHGFIDMYNYKRIHQGIGYKTPEKMYLAGNLHKDASLGNSLMHNLTTA
jgi:putative transposase